MLKYFVLLCSAWAINAQANEELEGLKAFLLSTQQDDNTTLQEAMTRNPVAKVWENSGKYQGDILFHDYEIDDMVKDYAEENNLTHHQYFLFNALRNTASLWPGGVVHYEVEAGFNQKQTAKIQEAVKHFEEHSCVRWVPRSNQTDYVLIGNHQRGCFAYVGYVRDKGIHRLNLAPDCFNIYVIIHEMSHIVGFNHMHQTYTRDNFVTIEYKNVNESDKGNFKLLSKMLVTLLDLPYEYTSNMHYGPYAFSKNREPTIVPKYNVDKMGQKYFVTRFDVLRLNRLYNCPGAWSVTVTEDDRDKPYDEEFAKRMKLAAEKANKSKR